MLNQQSSVLNTSGYKFIPLDHLEDLRLVLKEKALAHQLKGTILISEEGANIFLAGSVENLNIFRTWLEEDPRFLNIPWKESYSSSIPFKLMLI